MKKTDLKTGQRLVEEHQFRSKNEIVLESTNKNEFWSLWQNKSLRTLQNFGWTGVGGYFTQLWHLIFTLLDMSHWTEVLGFLFWNFLQARRRSSIWRTLITNASNGALQELWIQQKGKLKKKTDRSQNAWENKQSLSISKELSFQWVWKQLTSLRDSIQRYLWMYLDLITSQKFILWEYQNSKDKKKLIWCFFRTSIIVLSKICRD